MGRRRNTASIHAESSDGECDNEDGDKDDDGDGDAGIHAEPSVGRRGGHRVQEDASGICEPCPGIYTPSNIFATDANGET